MEKQDQAKKLSQVANFGGVAVEVTPHKTLNISKGVIRCKDLSKTSEEEILQELSSQGVIHVHHIKSKRDNKISPTNSFILTFQTPTLPSTVDVAYLRVRVAVYVPNPLRCFKCQRYGHASSRCSHSSVCGRCGEQPHEGECPNDPHCVNCSGDHPAFFRDCPRWHQEKAVLNYKYTNNVSFPEARKALSQPTYASKIISKPTCTCTCYCSTNTPKVKTATPPMKTIETHDQTRQKKTSEASPPSAPPNKNTENPSLPKVQKYNLQLFQQRKLKHHLQQSHQTKEQYLPKCRMALRPN